MHLVLPFAGALSPAAAHAASTLSLPHLERLLARWATAPQDTGAPHTPDATVGADGDPDGDAALTLSAPHERVLAQAWGWPVNADGLLPLAAQQALADGLAPDVHNASGPGWALLSPTHWHVGTDQVSLTDPAQLALDEAASRTLAEALRPLFDDEGFGLLWGAPTRWYAVHPSLATLPTASLDRVAGRNVDLWLNSHPDARRVRRLQAGAQMLLHTHPLNDAREAAGLLPVNSVWLSGTGQPRPAAPAPDLQFDDRLRPPALAEDWAAWADAWAALDAGPVATLLARADAGQPATLTLCGERHARRFTPVAQGWWQRLRGSRRASLVPVLEGL